MSERQHKKPVTDPEARAARQRRLLRGTSGAVVLLSVAALAASGPGSGPRKTAAGKLKTPAARIAEPLKRMKMEASPQEYLEGAKRNDAIEAAATNAGERIVAAAKDGKIGRFNFYNFKTEQWGRAGNPGWGALQHNPQYGGSPNQVSVSVYQDEDGRIDLTKGVQDVKVRIIDGKHPQVELRSPLDAEIELGAAEPARGWTTSVDSAQMAGFHEIADPANSGGHSTHELASIDHQAMAQVNQQLTQLGM
jgi:hypothetical protein